MSIESVASPSPPGTSNDRKVNIAVRSPIPAGKGPCTAEIEITEKTNPPRVSNIGGTLVPPPGATDGDYRGNVFPIPNGTKIKIVVRIKDKDGVEIGIRTIGEYIVGSPGVKYGDNPPEFDSELTPPPPPPPPGG